MARTGRGVAEETLEGGCSGGTGGGDSGAGQRAHLSVRPPGDAVLAASLLEDGDAQTELRGWVRG